MHLEALIEIFGVPLENALQNCVNSLEKAPGAYVQQNSLLIFQFHGRIIGAVWLQGHYDTQ